MPHKMINRQKWHVKVFKSKMAIYFSIALKEHSVLARKEK